MQATTSEHATGEAKRPGRWAHSVFGIACLLALLAVREMGGMPFGLVYDPNRAHCLTNFHLGLFVRHAPAQLHDDDLVMFKPIPALSYVRDPFILKRVAAVPGDRILIKDDVVSVNGRPIVHGLPLAGIYKRSVAELARDEIVPPGHVFLIGDADRSDDSRYWGYLEISKVVGTATRLF